MADWVTTAPAGHEGSHDVAFAALYVLPAQAAHAPGAMLEADAAMTAPAGHTAAHVPGALAVAGCTVYTPASHAGAHAPPAAL